MVGFGVEGLRGRVKCWMMFFWVLGWRFGLLGFGSVGLGFNPKSQTLCPKSLPQKTELFINPLDHSARTLYSSDGTKVPEAESVRYLRSLISWVDPFLTAFGHRSVYRKLRLVLNCSISTRDQVQLFQAVFIPILTYGRSCRRSSCFSLRPYSPFVQGVFPTSLFLFLV